jgi:hypothetical protein
MAETMGSLVDKICIAELKMFHILEQIDRTDLSDELRELSRGRLSVMRRQRDDLVSELDALSSAWSQGTWIPKVYRQFKLYNDPRFQTPHPQPSPTGRGRSPRRPG